MAYRNNKYGYNPQDENENQQQQSQLQQQKQLSAYDKKIAHKLFRNTLEWFEKYIGMIYPDYQIKKQIHDNNIKRKDADDPKKIESLFSSILFGYKATMEMMKGDKKALYSEVKKEYHE
jgi:hypothetical protein